MNNPLGKAIRECKFFVVKNNAPQSALLSACTLSKVCRSFLGLSVGLLIIGKEGAR